MIVQNKEIREQKEKPLGLVSPQTNYGVKKPFGLRLKEAREARGFSREELSKRLNGLVSPTGLLHIEASPAVTAHPGLIANLYQTLPELR